VSKILSDSATLISDRYNVYPGDVWFLRDSNGNKVGKIEVVE
jgi:hypothetical protein